MSQDEQAPRHGNKERKRADQTVQRRQLAFLKGATSLEGFEILFDDPAGAIVVHDVGGIGDRLHRLRGEEHPLDRGGPGRRLRFKHVDGRHGECWVVDSVYCRRPIMIVPQRMCSIASRSVRPGWRPRVTMAFRSLRGVSGTVRKTVVGCCASTSFTHRLAAVVWRVGDARIT